jgi:hypothetical protein
MNTGISDNRIDIEELFDWIEQQPELKDIREEAAATLCEYRPAEQGQESRIRVSATVTGRANSGLAARIWETVWVPGRNMRGKAFSSPELDASLNSVAKLMCISTLWDFFCTIPIFSKSLLILGGASLPAGTLLSFILLWASNVAGENSTDRRKGHAAKANWSLSAFVLLCLAKTAVSGVGIDLMIGEYAIASKYAQQLGKEKLASEEANMKTLRSKEAPALLDAKEECKKLESEQRSYNRATQEKEWISAYVKARGTINDQRSMQGMTTEQRINKYGSAKAIPGACNQRDALEEIKLKTLAAREKSFEAKKEAINTLAPLVYLETREKPTFDEHFMKSGEELYWKNGTEAVAQGMEQFFSSLQKGEFTLLGFSLFMLAVSVVLTSAASVMLYLTGKNEQVKASFTGELNKYRERRVAQYQEIVDQEEV